MADRWLQGDDPERDVVAALEGVAEVYVANRCVLRALADARVEEACLGLVHAFIAATAEATLYGPGRNLGRGASA